MALNEELTRREKDAKAFRALLIDCDLYRITQQRLAMLENELAAADKRSRDTRQIALKCRNDMVDLRCTIRQAALPNNDGAIVPRLETIADVMAVLSG